MFTIFHALISATFLIYYINCSLNDVVLVGIFSMYVTFTDNVDFRTWYFLDVCDI